MAEKIMETVTIDREVTGVIRDLIFFVKYLRKTGQIGPIPENDVLLAAAREFWDIQHGED